MANESSSSLDFEFLDDSNTTIKSIVPNPETESYSIGITLATQQLNNNNVASKGLRYDVVELNEKQLNFVSFYNTLDINIRKKITTALTEFNGINVKTAQKLALKGTDVKTLSSDLWSFLNNDLLSYIDECIYNMSDIKREEDAVNGDTGGGAGPQNVSDINGSLDSSTIDDSANIENPNISDIIGNGVVLGTIILTEAVTLYEIIGGVGTQANLTGNYSVIGIVKENNKYYYKVIDNATQKVYYMEMTDDVKFQTEYKNLLHIKENAMMLNSMEIGSDNFVKLADPNTIYFIQNETENNGITFYNVIDANDGKSYYIPRSDSVESISLDSIASIVDTPTTETTTVTGEGV